MKSNINANNLTRQTQKQNSNINTNDLTGQQALMHIMQEKILTPRGKCHLQAANLADFHVVCVDAGATRVL